MRRHKQYYSVRAEERDRAATAAWSAEVARQAQLAGARLKEHREVDDAVRLGRARRLVSAVERAVCILEEQVRFPASPAVSARTSAACRFLVWGGQCSKVRLHNDLRVVAAGPRQQPRKP